MNGRPASIDLETGEVIDDPSALLSPLQIALRDLARFKFATIETVRADPRLVKAPCLAVISVYLEFVTLDKRTLKPKPAFASTVTLMARACIKSKTTARTARRLLVENGYLVRIGETKDGCEKYRVENPHWERVQMHVCEATEYLKQVEAARREDERKKKRASPDRGSDIDPTQSEGGVKYWPDRGSDIDPKYLRGNLRGYGSEEEDPIQSGSTVSGYGSPSYQSDNDDFVFPAPTSCDEADRLLSALLAGVKVSEGIEVFFRRRLMAGTLTKSMVDQQRSFAA
ncbi:hypothetical protein C5748_25755 [Phyllobacterium phragmitis]|uniref:Uncharacterized protein n=1 Tax=Phyllobacterium phragmitis TaxID=2670329 RepID=A0A2S9IJF7_9HYPH|nr:hypothetical protein [Phyllobacterium phragmitis]PRD40673.1 hypothetical protein C5748_25755 [Phyllobacterium phragmitis]